MDPETERNPEPQVDPELETTAIAVIEQARAIQIVDQRSYDAANLELRRLKEVAKKIEEFFEPMLDNARQALESIRTRKKEVIARLKLEETDQALLAEMKRFLADVQRQQEEDRRAREAEAKRKQEEAVLATAIEAEQKGAPPESVDAILSQPVNVPPLPVSPSVRLDKGTYTREDWNFEITDMKKVVLAVAAGHADITLLQVNEKTMRSLARATKGTRHIPGVRFYKDTHLAVR